MTNLRRIDVIGERFDRLVPVAFHGKRGSSAMWHCICDCGRHAITPGSDLRNRRARSCGCRKEEKRQKAIVTHGNARLGKVSPTYRTWRGMLSRCSNPLDTNWSRYGARGISVCERWSSFEKFLTDMGERPKEMTIERKDNEGNYESTNCVWAMRVEQARNRRSVPIITIDGVARRLYEWLELKGINARTYHSRRKLGYSPEDAIVKIKSSRRPS